MSSCTGLAVRSVLVNIAASPFASALPRQDCCLDCLSYGLGVCQGSIAHIATRQLLADLHAHHHTNIAPTICIITTHAKPCPHPGLTPDMSTKERDAVEACTMSHANVMVGAMQNSVVSKCLYWWYDCNAKPLQRLQVGCSEGAVPHEGVHRGRDQERPGEVPGSELQGAPCSQGRLWTRSHHKGVHACEQMQA